MKPVDLLKWWPAILAVVTIISLGVETRLEVKTLKDNREGYKKQWEVISNLKDRVQKVEIEVDYLQRNGR